MSELNLMAPENLENSIIKNIKIETTEASPEPETPEQSTNKSNMTEIKLETGTIIKLRGLKGKKEFNGRFGVIKKHLENGRFQVMIDGDKDLSMKEANLEPLGQCPNKHHLVEKGLLFWPHVKGFSTPAIQWLDDEVLEKAFINPYDKNSPFMGSKNDPYANVFDYKNDEKTAVLDLRTDKDLPTEANETSQEQTEEKPKDDNNSDHYDDEEFVDDMMALKEGNMDRFRNYDRFWRNIEMNWRLDLIMNNSEKRKDVMKKYEDRLKVLLNWTNPTAYIKTVTHTDNAVENQVCIYFDADSKAPINDWLQIRFQTLTMGMPQIRGPFIYIGFLHKPRGQDTTENINYHKSIFHISKYFGQPQKSEYMEKYCNNLHKIMGHMASTNVCNDQECGDCEAQKANFRSLAEESEKWGMSQHEVTENLEMVDKMKEVCARKGIDYKKYVLKLAKAGDPEDPIVKEYLERHDQEKINSAEK